MHMIDFVLAVEQRIEEDVISCLKSGTHTKSGDDKKMVKVGWYPSLLITAVIVILLLFY